jgi:hypothetical protein
LPILNHNSLTISTAETVYGMLGGIFFICKCDRHFDYEHTVTQHSHTYLDNVNKQGLGQVTAVPAHSTSNSVLVSNWPVVYWAFFVPNDL